MDNKAECPLTPAQQAMWEWKTKDDAVNTVVPVTSTCECCEECQNPRPIDLGPILFFKGGHRGPATKPPGSAWLKLKVSATTDDDLDLSDMPPLVSAGTDDNKETDHLVERFKDLNAATATPNEETEEEKTQSEYEKEYNEVTEATYQAIMRSQTARMSRALWNHVLTEYKTIEETGQLDDVIDVFIATDKTMLANTLHHALCIYRLELARGVQMNVEVNVVNTPSSS